MTHYCACHAIPKNTVPDFLPATEPQTLHDKLVSWVGREIRMVAEEDVDPLDLAEKIVDYVWANTPLLKLHEWQLNKKEA